MGVQKRLVSAAPGYAGYLLEGDNGIYYHPLRIRVAVEEKRFVDELEEARIAAAMEANPCRETVVWRPQYPVLLGDFMTLFEFLRENPSEEDPSLIILEVVDPPEVEGPSAPRNLAAILQAVENGDSEVPAAEYGDASMEEADADDHVTETIPVEENPANDLTMEAADQNAIPLERSCEASSDEPSRLARTLEVIQKNQDEQRSINAEFRAFMERQNESNNGIHDMLAKIMSKLGSS